MKRNVAAEYGLAIFKLADETAVLDEVFDDFGSVNKAFEDSPELVRLLSNPRLTLAERDRVLEDIFGGRINIYLLNMLKILASKRLLGGIGGCWLEYRRLYCERRNILPVTVTSAAPLSDEQTRQITESLSKKTGSQILLSFKLDKSCLGGFILEYGGKRYDATVRNRLNAFKQSIIKDY